MREFTNEMKKDLILSIGTHKKIRKLTPIEVGERIKIARENNVSYKQLAEIVQLKGPTMLNRFEKLLNLSKNIHHLVDWNRNKVTISFTLASDISILNPEEQDIIARHIMEDNLNKMEIAEILEIKRKTNNYITECIERTIKRRTVISKNYLFIGTIVDTEVKEYLLKFCQYERDKLFTEVLNKNLLNLNANVKLGIEKFTLSGDKKVHEILKNLKPEFESVINSWLHMEISN